MSNETENSTKKVIAIGGDFNGGKVTAIFATGVTVIKGTYTRFYPQKEVEAALQRKAVVS
ncbi:hypothetical protein EBZ39_04990 [bacterium]|nr:hypothetical protein [bacterium]